MTRKPKQEPFQVRGLMLDPGRLTERHEFYFDLLPQLAEWGYNTLWWHFCDDEGCALKLKSHPELASPYAFTRSETRDLIRAAADVGIDVVPEVETWVIRSGSHVIPNTPACSTAFRSGTTPCVLRSPTRSNS